MTTMIERSESDGILTLRLAHGKASVLDLELCEELRRQLDAARDARALILTGTGSIFSAGVDLFRLTGGDDAYIARFWPALRDLLETIFVFPRPIIAAANGHAIAGGCLIVAACDYRLMSGGKIGVPELLVGVPFPAIAIEILTFAAGRDAQQLAYSGATVAPEEARSKGLIDEVIDADRLLDRAREVAERFAAIPADSFRISKLQMRRRGDLDAEALAVWSRPEIHAHIRDYLSRTVGRK
jgi:enoyl-CoA hydratase